MLRLFPWSVPPNDVIGLHCVNAAAVSLVCLSNDVIGLHCVTAAAVSLICLLNDVIGLHCVTAVAVSLICLSNDVIGLHCVTAVAVSLICLSNDVIGLHCVNAAAVSLVCLSKWCDWSALCYSCGCFLDLSLKTMWLVCTVLMLWLSPWSVSQNDVIGLHCVTAAAVSLICPSKWCDWSALC